MLGQKKLKDIVIDEYKPILMKMLQVVGAQEFEGVVNHVLGRRLPKPPVFKPLPSQQEMKAMEALNSQILEMRLKVKEQLVSTN